MKDEIALPEEIILSKIYLIRERKVMIDRDLALLYGVATKVLKQAVRRNIRRFPSDFMFEMNKIEFDNWRSQFVTSNSNKMGLRHTPFCFTENGLTMLSCILNSERAIFVNIQIIRLFNKMREKLILHKDLLLAIEKINNKVEGQEKSIKIIFDYLKQLELNNQQDLINRNRVKVGFKQNK